MMSRGREKWAIRRCVRRIRLVILLENYLLIVQRRWRGWTRIIRRVGVVGRVRDRALMGRGREQ